jgi:hypothetical protein
VKHLGLTGEEGVSSMFSHSVVVSILPYEHAYQGGLVDLVGVDDDGLHY